MKYSEEKNKSFISFTLDKKLVLLVMLVTVTALGITSYMNFDYATEILKQRGGDQLLGESTIRGETLRLLFESRIEQNNLLASDPMIQFLISDMNKIPDDKLKNVKEENRKNFLIQIQAFQELVGFSIGFEDVKMIGVNGKVFFSLVGISDEDFTQNLYFKRGLTGSFIDFEPSGTGKKMIVVSPVFALNSKSGDDPIGVVISKMRTTAMDNLLLNRSGLGETGEVYVVNDQFLMLSESRFFENAVFQQKVNTVAVQKCFNEKEDYVGFYPDYRGIPIYGSSYCAPDLGIVLLAEIDEKETIEPIKILQSRILLTSLFITMLMGLVAYFAAESISHPLRKLKKAANKIANGNLDVRTTIQTTDEIGELSYAFDSMVEKLQNSLLEIKDKENVIKQQENILLQFSNYSEKHCVCLVDIINSTKITSNLSDKQTSDFYKIFLNSIATIVQKFDGVVVKNIGDALLFYFPVLLQNEESVLKKCLNCCLSLCDSHDEIANKIKNENLPVFDYRLSATYGMVRIAKISTSSVNDIFGATVNRCSKINYSAPKNGLVIGQDFYDFAKSFKEFNFEKVEHNASDTTHRYPSYVVTKHNVNN